MNKREKKTKLNFVLLVGKRFVVTAKKVSKKGKSTKYIYIYIYIYWYRRAEKKLFCSNRFDLVLTVKHRNLIDFDITEHRLYIHIIENATIFPYILRIMILLYEYATIYFHEKGAYICCTPILLN